MSTRGVPPEASSPRAPDGVLVRDRYLFSADKKTTEYETVLEITPGHARLVTPSKASHYWRWTISLLYYIIYTGLIGTLLGTLLIYVTGPVLPSWAAFLLFAVLWIGGLFVLFFWWDRRSLPLLADAPSQVSELILLGATSFGTFQDVRARTMRGEELHLVVDATAPRFWEAVRLLEATPAPSG
jgi:hypothetical protein